jgi:hypothetical protein
MLVPEVVLATQQAAAFIKQGGIAPHRLVSLTLLPSSLSLCGTRSLSPLIPPNQRYVSPHSSKPQPPPPTQNPITRIGAYSSERQLTAAAWPAQLRAHDILIATGQSFLNVLLQRPDALAEIGLLVLDECHHTR